MHIRASYRDLFLGGRGVHIRASYSSSRGKGGCISGLHTEIFFYGEGRECLVNPKFHHRQPPFTNTTLYNIF